MTKCVATVLFALSAAAFARGVITDDPICHCTDCCFVHNGTETDFTGKTLVTLTYPKVSLSGEYTTVHHQYLDAGDALQGDALPYQYVVKYTDDNKASFDRNIIAFADTPLDCTSSHLFVGSPDDVTSKKIAFVAHDTENYCTLDADGLLSRDELDRTDEYYFAFNAMIDEGEVLRLMYDMTSDGLIVPEDDILYYPYVIEDGSVTAVDTNEATEFYIDVGLDVKDVSTTSGNSNEGLTCYTIDELFANDNAYWLAEDGSKCPVNLITPTGTGDAAVEGRNYHMRIDQTDYQTCAVKDVELVDTNLVFTFRLVLPRDASHTDGASADDDECRYFAQNENVQNITISVAQDVTAEIDGIYATAFNTQLKSVSPERCTPISDYPTPHSFVHFVIEAVLPGTFGVDFETVTLPDFDGVEIEWDTETGNQPDVIPCTDFDPTADPGDEYKVCTFALRSTSCEPTYETTDGECAFERQTQRLLTGFTLIEELPGGQTAEYVSDPINSGLDNTEFDIQLCEPEEEDAAIGVNDVFNVELALQNYYYGEPVDWEQTDNYTMNKDMIARLSVGQIADSPFDFDDDLELMIKTVTVELTNPVTEAVITSYSYSVSDKVSFMGTSWTPYFRDPRFCTFFDESKTDRCERFFVDGVRSNAYHDAAWIADQMVDECQDNAGDTNNHDFFIFNPRDWFQNNVNGYVDLKMVVSGVIHKCSANGRRLEGEGGDEGDEESREGRHLQSDPSRDILYVSSELVVSFITRDDGSGYVEVIQPPASEWISENSALLGVAFAVAASALCCVCCAAGMTRRRRGERYGKIPIPAALGA